MHSKEFLGLLSKHTGKFAGTGINHEGQKFTGDLELKAVVDGKGFQLTFLATGENGEVFHKETSMIAPSLEEKLVVWNFNNNTPGLTAHELKSIEKRSESTLAQFCFGDLENSSEFREQLDLEVFDDGDIKYAYSWGLPGGEFKERSGVRMAPKKAATASGLMTMNHLHLKVSDIGKSIEFYSAMFGFKEKVRFSEDFLFLQDPSGFDLALDKVESVKPMPDGVHFGFALKSRNEVEDLLEKFKLKYPHLIEADQIRDNGSWGDFDCEDPDGHPIQVYWDVDLH